MTISLKHNFVSTKPDGPDNSLVRPSDWNAEHTLTLAEGKILGRTVGSGTGAVQELPIAVDGSGKVGIGTSSPDRTLSVNGDAYATNVYSQAFTFPTNNHLIYDAGADIMGFRLNNGATPTTYFSINNAGSGVPMVNGPSGTLAFGVGVPGTEKMRIISNGNVGIATTSPGYPLDVGGGAGQSLVRINGGNTNAADGSALYFGQAGSTNVAIGNASAITGGAYSKDAMLFSTGQTLLYAGSYERLRIDMNGNVGIGASTVSYPLHVYRTSGGSTIAAQSAGSTGSDYGVVYSKGGTYTAQILQYGTGGTYFTSDGTDLNIGTTASSILTLRTNNTERMRIDASGNVGIGGTSTDRLYVYQNTSATDLRAVFQNGATDAATILFLQGGLPQYNGIKSLDNSGNQNWYIGGNASASTLAFMTGTTERMRINASGNVGIGTSSPIGATNYGWLTINGSTGGGSVISLSAANTERFRIQNNESVSGILVNTTANWPMVFLTNNTERLRIEAGGNVAIGTGTAASLLHVDNGVITTGEYGTNSALVLRAASGTQASPTQTTANFSVGDVIARGYDGTTYRDTAIIGFDTEASVTSTSSPGRITFATTPTGAVAVTERMRIYASGGVSINNTTDPGQGNLSVTGTVTANAVVTNAGTATLAPIDMAAGTNLSTPQAGAWEYDGTVFYNTVAANTRGVIPSLQILVLNAAYTLTSSTTAQKLFNQPTNGALTLQSATTYFFECMFLIDTMSATSGNLGFSVLGAGTATLGTVSWMAHGLDATTQTTATAIGGVYSTAAAQTGNITVAGTGTAVHVFVKGVIRCTTSGTIIPSINLTTANAAVVRPNSYFIAHPIGSNTVTTVGNWA